MNHGHYPENGGNQYYCPECEKLVKTSSVTKKTFRHKVCGKPVRIHPLKRRRISKD